MDPLSITVSVLTLLQLTEKFISYIKQTKDARKEQARVLGEASSLVWLLRELQECIDEHTSQDPWVQATSGLGTPGGPLDQYKHTLEVLASKIIPGHGLHKVGQVLAWKFSKEEVNDLLSQIERVKSLVLIALELDHSALSRAIKEDLQSLHTSIADLKTDTTTLVDTTIMIKSDTTVLLDENAVRLKSDLLQWICSVDYHVQHRDFLDRHQPGTGQWFLQDMKFQGWNQSKDATLFCPGIPGAGKTIMTALVIDHLLRSQHVADGPVTFIYCNYNRQSEQSTKHMLSSILRQIIDVQPGVPKLVQDFHTSHTTKKSTPSSHEIGHVLEAVSKDLRGLSIIVDALDECETRARQEFLSAIETLRLQCKVRLLATSRPLPPVQSHPTFLNKPTLEVRASNEDLEKYIRSRAVELHFRVMSKPDLLEDLVTNTVSATGGMFLLAQLLMDSFRDKLTVKDVKVALRNLPKGSNAYDAAYHTAMTRISTQGKGASDVAKKILAWILCSYRPLSTLELLHALAIEPGDKEIDEDNILDTEQLLTICAGLVTIDEQSDTVRFIHYTTQEYLQRTREQWLPRAEFEIARTCLDYCLLRSLYFNMSDLVEERDICKSKDGLIFAQYAKMHGWFHWNAVIQEERCLHDKLESLLRGLGNYYAPAYDSSYERQLSEMPPGDPFVKYKKFPKRGNTSAHGWTIVHLLSKFGFTDLVKFCICKSFPFDELSYRGQTPLSLAAEHGAESTVLLLLDHDAAIDGRTTHTVRSPLWYAAAKGQEAVVRVLLNHNAAVVPGADYALLEAADRGHELVVSLLLERNLAVDIADSGGRTPLSHAAARNHMSVMRLLVDNGAVVDAKDNAGRTPLSHATAGCDTSVMRLLVENGAVVDAKDNAGRTPLSHATAGCDTSVMRLLLEDGAAVDAKDNAGRTPLSYAVTGSAMYCRINPALQLLVENGAAVDAKDNEGRTPFSYAVTSDLVGPILVGLVGYQSDLGQSGLSPSP